MNKSVKIIKKEGCVMNFINVKKLIFCALILISTNNLFSQEFSVSRDSENSDSEEIIYLDEPSQYQRPRNPEPKPKPDNEKKEIPLTKVYVNSNVTGASVYLDGYYKGTSPLTIEDISGGFHRLEISKKHYATKIYRFFVLPGTSHTILPDLEQISGYLGVQNASNSEIYVDGQNYSYSHIELDEGPHNVVVKKFGYKDFVSDIFIYRLRTTNLNCNFEKADFEFLDAYASKEIFYPAGKGSLKNVKFTFEVNAPSSCEISIKNFEGLEVFATNLDFTNWENSFVWNGKDKDGNIVSDGIYKAEISNGEKKIFCSVEVKTDSSLQIPSLGYDGFGVGNIPLAYSISQSSIFLGSSLQFNLSTPEISIKEVPLNFALYFSGKHYELGSQLNFSLADMGFNYWTFNGKLFYEFEFNQNTSFMLGLGTRIGWFTQNSKRWEKYDNGAGFALSAMTGLNLNSLTFNLTSQVIFEPTSGFGLISDSNKNKNLDDYMFKNSLVIQNSFKNSSLGIYASLESCVNSAEKLNSRNSSSILFSAIDAGSEFSFYIGETASHFNLRLGTYIVELSNFTPYVLFGFGWYF